MSPRQLRYALAEYNHFHICSRGNNGQEIFCGAQDYNRYLSALEKYRTRYGLRCLAYCLMSNHVHLLFHAPSIQALSKTMQFTNGAYSAYFNKRHKRRGHLFQDRFSSWVIETEDHLIATKEYIENNPVKAGLTEIKEKYRWSSAFSGSDPEV